MSPKVSILINSYNYAAYIEEAIASALDQTNPPCEVIVVDDGSTDGTSDLVMRRFGGDARVKLVTQANGGQLAAFVAGFERAEGGLIFLLDADDRYERDHVESCVRAFREHPEVDFVFTGHRQFGRTDRVCQFARQDRHLGFSVARTFFRRAWIGSVTSTLALRRPLIQTLLPVLRRLEPRWRIRADDCIVIGASIAGAQKYFLAQPSVAYRTHETNHFHGRRRHSEADDYAHWIRRDSLVTVMARELGVRPEIGVRADVEFRALAEPTRSEYEDYIAVVRAAPVPLLRRLKMRFNLRRHFVGRHTPRERLRPDATVPEISPPPRISGMGSVPSPTGGADGLPTGN